MLVVYENFKENRLRLFSRLILSQKRIKTMLLELKPILQKHSWIQIKSNRGIVLYKSVLQLKIASHKIYDRNIIKLIEKKLNYYFQWISKLSQKFDLNIQIKNWKQYVTEKEQHKRPKRNKILKCWLSCNSKANMKN